MGTEDDIFLPHVLHLRFDGWFFNFESKFPDIETTKQLVEFLKYMTETIHSVIEGSVILW